MQKTKEPLYLPISDEALKWLPQRGEAKDDDFIFPLTHEGTINNILQKWAKDAGVIKHISFYAKIVDKKKEEAISLIPNLTD